ncbi:MAG: hypothetical protein Q9227_002422 [Pyrenula ochraceoflavens]
MDLDTGDSPWGDVPSQSTENNRERSFQQSVSGDDPEPPSTTLSEPAAAATKSTRGSKTPRKAQPTRLEAVDGSFDPLGPLGDTSHPSDEAPAAVSSPPTRKDNNAAQNIRPTTSASQASISRTVRDSEGVDDASVSGRTRGPPPVQPPLSGNEGPRRQTQPSMTVEQAAKPSFDITVGDPHKVGDLTTGHIVYQVRTRTSSKAYRQPEFAVSRRYRDFLWLYNSLHSNNPGIVVPPPPEKQAVGRFDSNFVESRRAALERMLNKTAAHPVLHHDGDLKIFLESDTFNMDVKNKENKEPDLGQSKGMFGSFGLSSSSGKFIEHDDWFHDRKIYLDALENQLKALLKSIDIVVAQRKDLAEAAGDFSSSLHSLSLVELSPTLSGPLEGLSALQDRLRELYDRQAQQDMLTLGITIDEYIRLIGSIKMAFAQRQKAFHSWHAAESELQKRKKTQDKLMSQGKSQQDRLNQLNADVADAERRVHQARLLFEDMGRLMRNELEKFEREKVEDFKSGVETFLEGAVEAQKEIIEQWESFLLSLDADDGQDPFFKPAAAAPPQAQEPSKPADTESATESAATATIDQEA